MIKTLTLKMNKLRQAAITTELIEVVSGAEALNGSACQSAGSVKHLAGAAALQSIPTQYVRLACRPNKSPRANRSGSCAPSQTESVRSQLLAPDGSGQQLRTNQKRATALVGTIAGKNPADFAAQVSHRL